MTGSVIISPIVVDQLDSNVGRVPVETKQSKDNAALSAFGFPVFVNEGLLKTYRYNAAFLNTEFTQTFTGSGAASIVNGSALQLSTGAAINSSAKLTSKTIHRYTSGRGQKTIMSIILGDSGVAGNVREWGYGDDTNGVFIRLDGTTLKFILKSGGVEVVSVNASSWDIPVTTDGNGHLWYIQFEWLGVGNYYIYYDHKLVHTYQFLGTSTVPSIENPDLPIRFRNENTTNNTNVILKNICAAVSSEGTNSVELTDSSNNFAKFSQDNRIRIEGYGSILTSENFADNIFNTSTKWTETIVSGGNKSVSNSVLSLNTNTTATSSIKEKYTSSGLQESIGRASQFSIRYSFGSTQQANNIREWGYVDQAEDNGLFFRLSNTTFYLVFKKGGVENPINIDFAKPDSGFHTYIIEQIGTDIFHVYIDGQKVYSSSGNVLIGNKSKIVFFKNYNTGALGGTPSASEIDWLNLLDTAGDSVVIVGKDGDGIPREIAFDSSGNVRTVSVISSPPNTSQVIQIQKSSTTSSDNFYTITNGKTLTIQRFSASAQFNSNGSAVELYYAPNGNTTGIELIDATLNAYSNYKNDLEDSFAGDGTKAILLRRRVYGGGPVEIFGRWQGYERD